MSMYVCREPGREHSVSFLVLVLLAVFLAYPPSVWAVEVGCFCTFVFVSTMFVIGVGATVVVKYALSRKMWPLSFKRTSVTTFLEVILLVAILIVLQTKFYLRVLAYLPIAFLLNYAMAAAGGTALLEQQKTPKKRAALAALSCLILPVAVQIMAWLAMFLSNMIDFKEVRV